MELLRSTKTKKMCATFCTITMTLDCVLNGISLPPVMTRMHVMAWVELKQEASKASLQATVVGLILTAKNLYDWGAGHLLNIKLFFISKEEVNAHVDNKKTDCPMRRLCKAHSVTTALFPTLQNKQWWCEGCQEMNLHLR